MKFLLDNILIVAVALVSGGMLLWPMIRRGSSANVSPARATQLINREDAVVLDVRDSNAYATARVLNARNVPLAQLDKRVSDIVKFKNRPVILYDDAGTGLSDALAAFRKHGFTNVLALSGGLSGWREAGLPVER